MATPVGADEKKYQEKVRRAARHLGCPSNESAIIRRCRELADNQCNAIDPAMTPLDRLGALADHCSVHFEVAHTDAELDEIVERYARKGELGFALRRPRFDEELLAAILRRNCPSEGDRTFVALVDARGRKEPMAFFSRAHEVAHPVLEPQLAFDFRDETGKRDRWETLVDQVGSEMVFSGLPWELKVAAIFGVSEGPTVQSFCELREEMARDASLTAVVLAAGNQARRPLLVVWVGEQASQRDPVPVLRVLQATPNSAASSSGTYIHPKRRVPDSSPIACSNRSGIPSAGFEDLGEWLSSDGSRLPSHRVWTAARPMGGNVFAIIDFGSTGS